MTCPQAWNLVQMFESKSGSCQECCPTKAIQNQTPVCHLTSQWSGRLRAAHSGAAHRRVRRQKEITALRHSNGMRERESTFSISGQNLERPFHCASLFVSLVGPLSRWQRSACVFYTQEVLAQGADAVLPGATPRGLTASHRPRLRRPGLRAMSGSQAQSGWRPSWAERPNRSETRARLTSPGSKQNDDLPEGLEPRTNVRKQNQSLPKMLPNQGHPEPNSSLPPNQPMERTPACCALRRRSSAR